MREGRQSETLTAADRHRKPEIEFVRQTDTDRKGDQRCRLISFVFVRSANDLSADNFRSTCPLPLTN